MVAEASARSDVKNPVGNEVRIRPPEFARRVGVSNQQVYRWIYSGRLKAALVGRAWFIPVSELEEFFDREAA